MSLRGRWLEAQVADWEFRGILTAEQASRLRRDIRERGEGSRVAPFTLLAAFGGLCVALGIILVIAYNWQDIHRAWKLGGFLVLLAASGEACGRLSRPLRGVSPSGETPTTSASRVAGAAARLVWLVLPLAGIGLWGQVYQLSGDGFRPLFLWLLLGLPLAWMVRDPVVAVVHAAGVVAAIFAATFDSRAAVTLEVVRGADLALPRLAAFAPAAAALLLLWAYGATFVRRAAGPRTRVAFLLAALVWLWSLTVGDTAVGARWMPVQFAAAAALVAAYWGLRDLAAPGGEGPVELGYLGLAAVLYFMAFLWHTNAGHRPVLAAPGIVYACVLAASGALLALRVRGWTVRGLLVLPVVLALLLVFREWYRPVAVLANLGLAAVCVRLMAEGIRRGAPGRINLGVFLLGLLVITRFLDYFGTMLQSGVAFIATGIVFIAVAWALNRGRQELLSRVRVER